MTREQESDEIAGRRLGAARLEHRLGGLLAPLQWHQRPDQKLPELGVLLERFGEPEEIPLDLAERSIVPEGVRQGPGVAPGYGTL